MYLGRPSRKRTGGFSFSAVAMSLDHFLVTGFFKALPREEGGERFIYIEASNETRDYQGERVLCKALEDSKDYYLRYGNIDLDHLTLLGPAQGIPDYIQYEIGQPVEVRIDSPITYIKAQLYRGDSVAAKNANEVWASMTMQNPPARWYPSIGGSVLPGAKEIDPETGDTVVSKVRWVNVGISKSPVNLAVPTVATMPFGVFAKAWIPGRGLNLAKTLTAGAATDSAAMTGGQALGQQSLDRRLYSYWQFRDSVSHALLKRKVGQSAGQLHRYAVAHGVPEDEAAEWVERFISNLKRDLKDKRKAA